MSLDIAPALRDALCAAGTISPSLGQWKGEPSVHTKRPTPPDAEYPLIVINPPAAISDEDFLNSDHPIVIRDIAVYGRQPTQLRVVDEIGFAVRALFHRQKWAITPEGYDVIGIVASGPIPGPTDDDETVARIVGLTIKLRRQT